MTRMKLTEPHMWHRMIKKLRQNQTGSVLVEFAFVAPAIFTAIIGTLEIGTVMLSNVLLEGAISEASRKGMTGYTADGVSREAYINDLLAQKTFGMINLNNLTIQQKIYNSFSEVGTAEPYVDADGDLEYTVGEQYTDMNCNDSWDEVSGTDGLGGPGDIVVYSVEYDADFLTGYFARIIGDQDGRIKLTASTVIQNEPFGAAIAGCTPQTKT